MKRRVVVIGAGIAGLTAAAQLAHRGYDVHVVEKQAIPGGRAAQAQWEGFRFDLGPTLLFMLDVYRTAFASWGGDFDREVPTIRLRPNYTLHYPDGKSLVITSLLSETMASLDALAPGSSRGFLRYFAEAAESYEISRREFVGRRIPSFASFFTPNKLHALWKTGALARLATRAKQAFGDDRVAGVFLFNRCT